MEKTQCPNRLVITRGLPGSGKSTLAKAWVQERPDRRARVNRDDLRGMLQGGRLGTIEQEQAVTLIQQSTVRELLRAGWSVVCDDTNLVTKFARGFATLAAEAGAEFEVWDLSHIPLQECLRRDVARPVAQQVGEAVIRSMYERHVKPLRRRGFPPVEAFPPVDQLDLTGIRPYVQPALGEVPDAILVDLDGTAALMGGRDPYDYAAVGDDTVNEPVREAVLAMAARDYMVVFASGRDEVCRPGTEKWLREHYRVLYDGVAGWAQPPLFMRPKGDTRKDWIVKHELFLQDIAGRWRITTVFDDRAKVVRMWRALGLTVFQVAEGPH